MRNKAIKSMVAKATSVRILKQYFADENGATAIEYGLIAALIGVMTATGASALGGELDSKFSDISLLLSGPGEPAASGAGTGP